MQRYGLVSFFYVLPCGLCLGFECISSTQLWYITLLQTKRIIANQCCYISITKSFGKCSFPHSSQQTPYFLKLARILSHILLVLLQTCPVKLECLGVAIRQERDGQDSRSRPLNLKSDTLAIELLPLDLLGTNYTYSA